MLCPCLAAILTGRLVNIKILEHGHVIVLNMTRHCGRWWYWYRHPVFAAQYTTEGIDSKITPPALTKLTGGGPTDPGDDATIWCQPTANQRPGFRSRDHHRPIRGRLTTSSWRGVNQSQILIFCSSARQATQAGARGKIEDRNLQACGENREISLSLILAVPPPFQLLLCLFKNVRVIVSLHSSKLSVIHLSNNYRSHYQQYETDPSLRLHYSAITVSGKTLSY